MPLTQKHNSSLDLDGVYRLRSSGNWLSYVTTGDVEHTVGVFPYKKWAVEANRLAKIITLIPGVSGGLRWLHPTDTMGLRQTTSLRLTPTTTEDELKLVQEFIADRVIPKK